MELISSREKVNMPAKWEEKIAVIGSGPVFAGGDAVTGPATVIEAIVASVRAENSIDKYLRGKLGNE